MGRQVANIRAITGMSQGVIARSMTERGHAWHQTTVSRIERGEQPLSLVEAAALAEILDTDLGALLGDSFVPRIPTAHEMLDSLVRNAQELRYLYETRAE